MDLRSESVRKQYHKQCEYCAESFVATRSDQKFCRPNCRYRFHNDDRRQAQPHYGKLKTKLEKNLRILASIYDSSERTSVAVERDKLLMRGFDFNANTGNGETKDNRPFSCVFGLGVTNESPTCYIFKVAA